MPSTETRPHGLVSLYEEIYRCTACVGTPGCKIEYDPERVRRRIVPTAIRSEVFLVGQALGGRTQRRSGLPYCYLDQSLSPAGRRLEVFLRTIGYSIEPFGRLRYVYSSDTVQHYPGRKGRGDRQPTKAECDTCSFWLGRELALVRPKLVVLLVSVAARDFLQRYGAPPISALGEVWGKPHKCTIDGRHVVAVPVPHFSSRLPRDRPSEFWNASVRRFARSWRRIMSGATGKVPGGVSDDTVRQRALRREHQSGLESAGGAAQ